jgi:hypothetical protein
MATTARGRGRGRGREVAHREELAAERRRCEKRTLQRTRNETNDESRAPRETSETSI